MATGFFENDLQSYRGPLGSILMSQEFYETDPKRDFARGYMLQMIRGSGPAATAIGLDGVPGRVPWGPEHHKEFALRFGKTAGIVILGEDLPDEQNEVVLDNVLTDSDNIAAPQIRYKVSRNSRKILDHGLRMAKRVLERAGAHTILENPLLANAGWHLMGTARLGEDPNRSVLNPWGQTHDVDNLFVIDGSAFVTAGAVNPTPTIQALALRTADYILNHRTDLRS
jgi:choline dehydrogenase-like flavoprotein